MRTAGGARGRRALVAVLCTTGAMLPLASGEAVREGAKPESVEAEFAEICREIRESYDPFYGELRSREVQRRLEAGVGEPLERAALTGILGREYLKLARTDEAIALLERTAAEPKLTPDLRLDTEVHLGLAHLQAAEDENCIASHTADSCLLPIRPGGVHRRPEHARLAGDTFLAIARRHPRAVQTLWLLNLARMISGDYPQGVPQEFRLPAGAMESGAPFPRWRDRAPELGVAVVDLAGGAAMDDFDGDGLLDLVTSTWDPCDGMKAFRNDGRGGFEDVSRRWGLDRQWGGLNLVHGDYDGDGRLDLLVLRGAWMGELGRIRNSLLRNELGAAGGGFRDVTREAGVAEPAYPTQTAAFADYDGDGDLDLYVGAEDPDPEDRYASQLFRNNGDGTFSDVTAAAGVANFRFAKAVTWGDYDDDGDPDLYVSNIGPNRLYRNDGPDGDTVRFTDVAPALGVTEPSGRSFASWFFDFDNDGDLDLFVADYESPVPAVAAHYFGFKAVPNRPRLYRNDGGGFTDVATEKGLARPLLPMGSNYGDLDNDGYPDIYLGTGEPGYETVMPNIMFHNQAGRRFVDVSFAGGFAHLQKGHGVAFGDLDNDGDQDLFHQLGGFFPGDSYGNALFENPSEGTSWITLLLEGRQANRFAVGARIEVRVREGESRRSVHALAGWGGSFGGSSLRQEIGLGRADEIEEVVVSWPGSGRIERYAAPPRNRAYRAVEGRGVLEPVALPRLRLHADDGPHHHHESAHPAPGSAQQGKPAT
jgi:hypothetical protein